MNIPQIPLQFDAIIPEIVLTAFTFLVLLLGVLRINKSFLLGLSVFFLVSTIPLIFIFEGKAFGEMFLNDSLAIYLKFTLIMGATLSMLMFSPYLKYRLIVMNESLALIMFATIGMMLLVSSRELISFFVSLEMMALSCYALVATRKYDHRANEAAIKYFMLGGLSTVIMLFGIALIYGSCKTTDFVYLVSCSAQNLELSLAGVGLFTVGLCFKIALVPLHMWAPDVYEGAPTPVTAFISTLPKVAVFGAFGRFLVEVYSLHYVYWSNFLIVLSLVTIVVGNLLALPQRNIKRMLAYSSIAHAGYVVMGLISGTSDALYSVVAYMFVYTIMNIGAFAVVVALNEENIENYRGIHKFHPVISFAMLVFMFSLTGVPPTAGFIAKFYVFKQAIEGGFTWLVVIAVLFTVVSAYYYLRVVMYMYMKEPIIAPSLIISRELIAGLFICVLGALILGILPVFLI